MSGKDLIITALESAVDYVFQLAVSLPPPKRDKQGVTAGSEAPAWGDSITCVIS